MTWPELLEYQDDMCKEVGAFPKCTCPNFFAPNSTPGVMTWPDLLERMDNLSECGHGQLKTWNGQATQLQIENSVCTIYKVAGVCVDMCKAHLDMQIKKLSQQRVKTSPDRVIADERMMCMAAENDASQMETYEPSSLCFQ